MIGHIKKIALATASLLVATGSAQEPAAIYTGGIANNGSKVLLNIGNGGAGQSGLIKGMSIARVPQACNFVPHLLT